MTTPVSTCEVRPAAPSDDAFLRDLSREVRRSALPPGVGAALIDLQAEAQRAQYAAAYPSATDHVLEVEGRPVGRLLLAATTDGLRVVDVAVVERERGSGAGTAALRWCCGRADAAGRDLTLTVTPDNPARRLYLRLGFEVESISPTAVAMRRVPGRTSHA